VFVFDGKPPMLEGDRGTDEDLKSRNEECKKLLRLLGVPVVEALGEAEAQCAELVRAGKVYASGSSGMEALTFGSKIHLRNLTVSKHYGMTSPLQEYSLKEVLAAMRMTKDQFTDLCILLGCGYCTTIKGIEPKKAVELIQKHGNIEGVLKTIDKKKYQVPPDWRFRKARQLFDMPDIHSGDEIELNWTEPMKESVLTLLVTENGFNEERVRTALDRLPKSRESATQGKSPMVLAKGKKRHSTENGTSPTPKK